MIQGMRPRIAGDEREVVEGEPVAEARERRRDREGRHHHVDEHPRSL
jgi:hypothetical protein